MKILRRSRRGLATAAAAALALGMAGSLAPSYAMPDTSSPYTIDGTVPDEGATEFGDLHGSTAELGPVNASSTKLGVIHTAPKPMLAPTNPNAQVDLRNVYLATDADASGDIWLYLGWERDSNKGSGVIMYEFQQGAKPVACDYSKIGTPDEADVIASCNPFENRQPGDFLLVWDQQGGATDIGIRTWGFDDLDGDDTWDSGTEPLTLGETVNLTDNGDAEAVYSSTKYFGEATVNLSDTIFPETPTSCFTVGNVIPGTITGNSDTADYKDVVLDDFTDAVSISNCGSVKITKVTDPAGGTGQFEYTLARDGDDPVDYADPPKTTRTGTLTEDGDYETQSALREATDYTLAEKITAGAYDLRSIVCTLGDADPIDVTEGATFPVAASEVTNCVITNDLQKGTLNVTKVVVNNNGGLKAATDFSFTATGQNDGKAIPFESDGTNTFTVDAGTYAVAESGVPISGYTTTYTDNCSAVEVLAGGSATCTITNDDVQPQLKVTKFVTKDNGGTKAVSDFPLFVGETSVVSGEANSFNAGTYQVSETQQPGYTAGDWGGDCSADGKVTLAVGDPVKECTITNDDQPGTLIVNKVVVNDNGGTLGAGDFTFQVNGDPAIPFIPGSDPTLGSKSLTVDAGTYTVTEPDVEGYTEDVSGCVDVVVPNGGTASCTITNDDDKASPSGMTTQRWVLHDTLGIANLRQGAPDAADATATFRLYKDAVCLDQVGIDEQVGVDGTAASTVDGITVTDPGYYFWRVQYSGDQYNSGFTTACGDEVTLIYAKHHEFDNLPVGP